MKVVIEQSDSHLEIMTEEEFEKMKEELDEYDGIHPYIFKGYLIRGHPNKKELFTYNEVKSILCDACKNKIREIRKCDEQKFYHVLDGIELPCKANHFRNKVFEIQSIKGI